MTIGEVALNGLMANDTLRRLRTTDSDTSPEIPEPSPRVTVETLQGSVTISGARIVAVEAVPTTSFGSMHLVAVGVADSMSDVTPQMDIKKPRVFGETVVYARRRTNIGVTPAHTAFEVSGAASWLASANADIDELTVSVEAKKFARAVAAVCAELPLDEPMIDEDQQGDVHLFFKERAAGVLLVISASGKLQVFGNEFDEKWRAQYQLSGRIWKESLGSALQSFCERILVTNGRTAG